MRAGGFSDSVASLVDQAGFCPSVGVSVWEKNDDCGDMRVRIRLLSLV